MPQTLTHGGLHIGEIEWSRWVAVTLVAAVFLLACFYLADTDLTSVGFWADPNTNPHKG